MSDTSTQTRLGTATTGADALSTINSGAARFTELAGAPVRCVARVSVGIDVMGGIAELGGALSLAAPTADHVRVAVAPRSDQRLRLITTGGATADCAKRNGQDHECTWELRAFYAGDQLAAPHDLRDAISQVGCMLQRSALAGAYTLLADRLIPHLSGGFSVVVECDRDAENDAQVQAAAQVATAAAICRALDVPIDRARLAAAACRVRGALLGAPAGMMTLAAPVLARAGELLQVCCASAQVGQAIPMPAGATLIGVDCGVRHPQTTQKYAAAITAALMGREIIECLMPEVCPGAHWDGHLARVSVTDFVDHLRDRIPTKLKGANFLNRFGPLPSAPTPIEPNVVYKVRSRAEHHIYEDDRVRQFAERLNRAARTRDVQPVREAGELMYASHWSYGQRCGLGSIETDLLVNLFRAEGPEQGIYGARVSGTGCGGTVVVLLRDDERASASVSRVLNAYRAKLGRNATLRTVVTSPQDGAAGLAFEPAA